MHTEKTTELRIECPACDNLSRTGRMDPVCYLNADKGTYYCHRCGAKGSDKELNLENLNIVSIKEKAVFDPKVYDSLEPLSEIAIAYLNKRFPGFTPEDYKQFGLKYSPQYHAIAIPCFNDKDEVQGIKYRFIAPTNEQRFIAETGSHLHGYWIKGRPDKVLVVEGELDAISAYLLGFKGTIAAVQRSKPSPELLARLTKFKNVFLNLDNDVAGQEGIDSIKAALGMNQPQTVTLPEGCKDLNDLLAQLGSDKAAKWLRQATLSKIEAKTITVESRVPAIVSYLKDKELIKGQSTGWQSLDRIFAGGLRKKEFTVLNGFFKRGKTTFLTNLTYNLALSGIKCAISSFEMDGDTQLFPNYLSLAYGSDVTQIPTEEVDFVINGLMQVVPELNNIALFDNYGKTKSSEAEEWVRYVAQEGFEFVILDHSGFMLEQPGNSDENETLAPLLAALAIELNIHIICVVQAPKPAKDKSGSFVQELNGLTAFGGTAWAKACSNFLALQVDFETSMTKLTLKEAGRNRRTIRDEEVWLIYDRETGRLTE